VKQNKTQITNILSQHFMPVLDLAVLATTCRYWGLLFF